MAEEHERQDRLELISVNGSEFLRLVNRIGHSPDLEGRIGSQYEAELERGSADVEVLGLAACNTLVGAVSFAAIPLPREPGTIGGRIDVVVTRPDCRRLGIGTLLMAGAMEKLAQQYRDRLRSISVVAVHPSVARFAEQFAFQRAAGDVPLYTLVLSPGEIAAFTDLAVRFVTERFGELRRHCVVCRRLDWSDPWCKPRTSGR